MQMPAACIVANSEPFRRILDTAARVALSDSDTLLLGETGTGKELVAKLIHDVSRRRDARVVRVDCGSLVASLFESALFGHVRGAFTGATQRRDGLVALANGGTLLLDEIGDLPIELQPKLLRLLQEREYEVVGDSRTQRADVRVIAATHVDLNAAMAAGRFRADLYHRLSGFVLRLPALRERPGDIAPLATHFLAVAARILGRPFAGIAPAALDLLMTHAWPGNVRELKNAVTRACVMSRDPMLSVSDFELGSATETAKQSLPVLHASPARETTTFPTLKEMEREHIQKALHRCGGTIEGLYGASAALGLPASSVRFRMRKLGIARHN